MAVRKILTRKDPALAKKCHPVTTFDRKLHDLLDDMKDTLLESQGVGLAAPQIGILRRVRGCPPFRDLFLLTASGPDEHAVLRACLRLRRALESALEQEPYKGMEYQVLGPAPAAVTKVNNRYRYRVTVSGKNDKKLRELIAHLVRSAQQDKENRGISVFADVNPLDG